MRIGLVDIDGHHFPNLALMKLSTWHKSQGDSVEFADPMFGRYDRVYMSKVFTFTPDCPDIYHCEVIRGGTGFRDYTTVLPGEIEHICPDYSLYGVNEAYGFLTRGCPNRCPWCIVPHKEGAIRPASPLREFIGDKRRAVLLDNNVLASDFGLEQIEEIIRMGIAVDFNQGLDARRACDDPYILDLLARAKWIQHIRFACDRMSQLEAVTKCVKELGRRGIKPYRIFVYCLIQKVLPNVIQDAHNTYELTLKAVVGGGWRFCYTPVLTPLEADNIGDEMGDNLIELLCNRIEWIVSNGYELNL